MACLAGQKARLAGLPANHNPATEIWKNPDSSELKQPQILHF
ncbi:hypothetical protein COLO4_00248 [Corchorus olitorius]|uniref:Uncharacterized protein n=1 Tax=Corchorus olitorius TaxID=93759 RepID=A0A1R3L4E3_9ROSI|nr:hypothetical protein COLO4_00248 [Corchorus olitorius]